MSSDKAAIERELQQAWDELAALVDDLSDEEMEQPGVVEEWAVKDLLGHMAFWAEKAAHDLSVAAEGRIDQIEVPRGEEQVAEWNAREAAARRGLSLVAVREGWEKSFDTAKAALRATPAEVLDMEVAGWTMFVRFAEDTYRHYREHAEQIRGWQRQLETTEV